MARDQIVLGGFGGQGIILAGFILGQAAAIYDKKQATFTQDYGPEARGGACRAQVVISESPISYPYVDKPSVLVVMSQEAYTRYALEPPFDGPLLIDSKLVKPRKSAGHRICPIPATTIAGELGRSAVANIIMLGFLAAVAPVVSPEALKSSIVRSVPQGTEQLNLKAFERGFACGTELAEAG